MLKTTHRRLRRLVGLLLICTVACGHVFARPVLSGPGDQLAQLAREVHARAFGTGSWAGRKVTAIAQMRDGTVLVGSSQLGPLPPQLRAIVQEHNAGGETWRGVDGGLKYPGASSPAADATEHLHGEMAILRFNRFDPHTHGDIVGVGASKPACPDCAESLRKLGIPFHDERTRPGMSGWTAHDSLRFRSNLQRADSHRRFDRTSILASRDERRARSLRSPSGGIQKPSSDPRRNSRFANAAPKRGGLARASDLRRPAPTKRPGGLSSHARR